MRHLLGFATLLFVLESAPSAHAEGEPRVYFHLKECPELDAAEVRRVLAAEVGDHLTDKLGLFVSEATASCEGNRLLVTVVDAITRKVATRRFDLGSTPRSGRERLAAVATAELLYACWAELESSLAPRVEPEGLPPPKEAMAAAREAVVLAPHRGSGRPVDSPVDPERVAPRSPAEPPGDAPPAGFPRARKAGDGLRVRSLRLLLVGSHRAFLSQAGGLDGGGMRLADERLGIVSWSIDSLLEQGHLQGNSQRYDLESASFGAMAGFFWRTTGLTARVGAGLRGGFVRVVSEQDSRRLGSSSLGLWGWPLLSSSLTFFVHDSLVLDLSAEGGYALLPLSSSASELKSAGAEAWLAGQVGIGFLL